jgi:dipeptidyl aminopeptidase/acylaminoacyl peptidase
MANLIPRAHLFGNPAKFNGQVSPDGARIAWIAPVRGVKNLWVAPIAHLEAAAPVTQDTGRGVPQFNWAYDGEHLVYHQDETGEENWHVHAVNIHTRVARDLTPFDGTRALLHGLSRKIRGEILVSINRRDPKYFDLFRIDLRTGAISLMAENPGFAVIVADELFRPRLALRTKADGGEVWMRIKTDGSWEDWLPFSPEDAPTSGFAHLDASGEIVFLRDSRDRDTAALVRMHISTGDMRVLAHDPRVDVGGALPDPETYEPRAYHACLECLDVVVLDPAIQPDLEFLKSQNLGEWEFVNGSEDDRLWVVQAHSDVYPGGRFLYDRPKRTLSKLYDVRPELMGAPLARTHPISITARDGLRLVSYLTLPVGSDTRNPGVPDEPLPMVLMVHGGPWGRDIFGFISNRTWLANRGYAVLNVNFRGSTGFGKNFVNAADGEWGRKMDDDLLDAVAWAIAAKIADPAKIAIEGGSYGGYATLVGLTRNPDIYACGIDLVGPSNLETLVRSFPPYWESIRAKFHKAVGNPETETGRALLRERSPLFKAEHIKRPLLIVHGANDVRVQRAEADRMVAALKAHNVPVTYALFPDEGHTIERPENSIAYRAIAEAFLANHLGGGMEPIARSEIERSSLRVLEGADLIEGLPAIMESLVRVESSAQHEST